uniref:Elongation of very long chain fatty acids protein n=1 Tax=Parastrongyloides trichosuri TaxID=131310 RepID=A0A0N4ZDS8_PARTI
MNSTYVKELATKILSPPTFDGKEFIRLLTHYEYCEDYAIKWTKERIPFVFQVVILYLIVIFGIQRFMKNREPFQLTIPLAIWNGMLTIYSIWSCWNLKDDFFRTVYNKGFVKSWCVLGNYSHGTTGYIVWLFAVSKIVELGDTIFLVLRKKPLMFLHWYHHIVTLIFTFTFVIQLPAFTRWGVFLNFLVHSFMYFYFFLRCLKVRLPKVFPVIITSLQIIQFVISCSGLVDIGYRIYILNEDCDTNTFIHGFASIMDLSYLLLFINLFINSYLKRSEKVKEE